MPRTDVCGYLSNAFSVSSLSGVLSKCFFIPLFCVLCFLQSQVAEKGRELKELKDTLAVIVKEKEKLEGVSDSFHFLLYRLLPL